MLEQEGRVQQRKEGAAAQLREGSELILQLVGRHSAEGVCVCPLQVWLLEKREWLQNHLQNLLLKEDSERCRVQAWNLQLVERFFLL